MEIAFKLFIICVLVYNVLFLFLSKYVTKINLASLTHCVIYSALFTPGEMRMFKNIFFIDTLRRRKRYQSCSYIVLHLEKNIYVPAMSA